MLLMQRNKRQDQHSQLLLMLFGCVRQDSFECLQLKLESPLLER